MCLPARHSQGVCDVIVLWGRFYNYFTRMLVSSSQGGGGGGGLGPKLKPWEN